MPAEPGRYPSWSVVNDDGSAKTEIHTCDPHEDYGEDYDPPKGEKYPNGHEAEKAEGEY